MSEAESTPTPPTPPAPSSPSEPATTAPAAITAPAATTAPAVAAASAVVAAPAVPELIDIDHFAKVKLRVAQVVSAEKVEKSKKLLKLQVDMGAELGQRQILSGIAQFYTPEQLVGRRVIVVTNLKPAKLMGLESNGMLLAASTPDHSALTIVAPSEEIPVGSAVS